MHTNLPDTPVILVVDDEPMITLLLSEILRQAGYPVLSTVDANEALRICQNQDPQVMLAIVDCIMPGRSGPELAASLKKLQPGMRIMLMSGYTDADLGAWDAPFLHKPFNVQSAVAAVQHALAA